jgi:hypothetical protein
MFLFKVLVSNVIHNIVFFLGQSRKLSSKNKKIDPRCEKITYLRVDPLVLVLLEHIEIHMDGQFRNPQTK